MTQLCGTAYSSSNNNNNNRMMMKRNNNNNVSFSTIEVVEFAVAPAATSTNEERVVVRRAVWDMEVYELIFKSSSSSSSDSSSRPLLLDDEEPLMTTLSRFDNITRSSKQHQADGEKDQTPLLPCRIKSPATPSKKRPLALRFPRKESMMDALPLWEDEPQQDGSSISSCLSTKASSSSLPVALRPTLLYRPAWGGSSTAAKTSLPRRRHSPQSLQVPGGRLLSSSH